MDPTIINFLNGFSLAGIPAVLLLPIVVEGLKKAGMPTHWTGIASIVVAALIGAGIYSVDRWPDTGPVVKVVVAIVLLGLAVPGTYSQAMMFAKGNPNYPKGNNSKED